MTFSLYLCTAPLSIDLFIKYEIDLSGNTAPLLFSNKPVKFFLGFNILKFSLILAAENSSRGILYFSADSFASFK